MSKTQEKSAPNQLNIENSINNTKEWALPEKVTEKYLTEYVNSTYKKDAKKWS